MNITQTAAQNLAGQGATFQGRSLIFKRLQELSPEKALKRIAKGRPVEAVIEDRKFPLKQDSDVLELNFFHAQGSDRGLQDPDLAHCLRDAPYRHICTPPMRAYYVLTQTDQSVMVREQGRLAPNLFLRKDGALALGFFSGVLKQPERLANPEKARSLLQLQQAVGLSDTPTEAYMGSGECKLLNHTVISQELLNDSQKVNQILAQIDQITRIESEHSLENTPLGETFRTIAWQGGFDAATCEKLLERFAGQEQGMARLSHLLTLAGEKNLPNQEQVTGYEQMVQVLPEGTPVTPEEFDWLTREPKLLDERLAVLNQAKALTQHDESWQRDGMDPEVLSQLQDPQRMALMQALNTAHPLNRQSFELAGKVSSEQSALFAQVYEEASRAGLEDLSGIWSDASEHWADTYQRLRNTGLDPQRAVLAASALGPNPRPQMLHMASELKNEERIYEKNDYVRALKYARGLKPQEIEDFTEVFGGTDLTEFQQIWPLTQVYGMPDAGYRAVLKAMKQSGLDLHRFAELRESGASAKTLLDNLVESPEQKALRAQRWVAYTARQLGHCQANVASLDANVSSEQQKQAQELGQLDHWYIPSEDYFRTLKDQKLANRWNDYRRQDLNQAVQQWDQRLAGLQAGNIPWGEPPMC
ncbi:MAG: hypothetical protein U0931_40890 [Vulcanimicrobiota bacterium]